MMFRSSLPEVFCQEGALKNFAKFTENTCARVSFNKVSIPLDFAKFL